MDEGDIHTDQGLSDSRFTMWRAVVAMIHVDGVVLPHEINCILETTRDIPFTPAQRAALNADLTAPQDVGTLFAAIASPRDREDFFHLARAVSWSDGNLDEREETLLRKLGMDYYRGQASDAALVSHKKFQDIYIEGRQANGDERLFTLIRGLIKGKAA